MPAYPEDSGSGSEYDDDQGLKAPSRKRGRGAKATASKRARHDTMESDMITTDATLFEIVRQGRMAMTAVVDDWIEAYKADRNGSLLDLIQFFIHAAGCKGTVTPQMLREATEGFQDVIKRMTEEFDEDSGDYPLIAAGSHFKKFRSNFCDFVQALVRQCQYQIIYDQFMMDNILTLLTELSNSQVRAFRHTSTLAAMKLMTGLVNVALQLSVSLDNTQRQYDGERNKTLSKRASEKLDILLQKRKELEEQQSEIESMLNGIFKGIFVHRYRDYIADIRALCMEEIGIWMKMFPKVFLTDSYLKYVGWTLHDKQKEVRSKCLNTLIGLYGDTEMTRDLKLFTSRFKDRIVSMTLDKEYDVAVLAIKLLVLILVNCGYDTPVLTTSDSESVYQLVFSCHRPVALAAAEFLNKQLFMDKDVHPGYTKRGKRRGTNAPLISDMVMFFIESELHEHATYLVDSLWDVAGGMLKDWECMSDMLLEEPANDRDTLDERQESALVDIMVCSVKQAAEGVPPSGRQGYSKKTASRDRKTAIEDKVRLTEHFIIALPNLLKKFHVDKEKVACLLQIPRYFDLEFYTTSRLEKHLDDLLGQIAIVIDKHTDSEVLEQASRTFGHLCDDEYTIYSKVSVAKRSVIDTWSENFRLALDIFKEAGDDADEEEVYNVVQSLKRLTYLYMFNDLTTCELHPPVTSIIQMHQERTDAIPEPMLRQSVKFIYYDLVYGLVRVKEQSEGAGGGAGAEDPRVAISQLRQQVTEYLRSCELLLLQSPHKKVQEASFMSICDLLVMFAPQLANSCPTLKPLVQRAPDQLQHALLDFVRNFVFIMPEEDEDEDDTAKIDALHRRRSLLAAVCKLFVFRMIDLRLAASVFQQYIRFYSDYGDIIKETISRSRHISKLACAQTLALSLMTLFRDTVRDQGGELDHSSQEYGHMKELARRFALTFGLDQVKTRDAVAELHKEGILFALKREDGSANNELEVPPNLSFLGILVEFSAKLMRQDKKTVVQYLDRHINPRMLSNQDQTWIPLVTYRNSLLQGADDDQKSAPAKSRRARRRKNEGDFEAPATPRSPATPMQQHQAPMTPQQPMTPQNTMGHPQLTSTVVRGMQGVADGHQPQMPDDHSMQYQPDSLRSWLNSEQKTSRRRSKSTSRSYEARRHSGKKNSGKAIQSIAKKSVKAAAAKRSQSTPRKRHRQALSEDEGFVGGDVEGSGKAKKCAVLRRSERGKSRSVLSYEEKSDDDFESAPPAASWQNTGSQVPEQENGVKTAAKRGSCLRKKKSGGRDDRRLFEVSAEDEDLVIGDFDDDDDDDEQEGSHEVGGESKTESNRRFHEEVERLPENFLKSSSISDGVEKKDSQKSELPRPESHDFSDDEVRISTSDLEDPIDSDLSGVIDSPAVHPDRQFFVQSKTTSRSDARVRKRDSSSDLSSTVHQVNNPFQQIVSKAKEQARLPIADEQEDSEENVSNVSSDEDEYQSSDDFQTPTQVSGILKKRREVLSSESSEESDDYESVDEENLAMQIMQGRKNINFRVKKSKFPTPMSSQPARQSQAMDESPDENEFGEFQDIVNSVMLDISQRSQMSSQTSDLGDDASVERTQSTPTMVSDPIVMTQTQPTMQAAPVPDYQNSMNVGYPMNAPQPSPIPQMGAPQHPGMQYMHPNTPAGMYQHGSSDPFQGVMSPMQQLGMPAQSPYYGN